MDSSDNKPQTMNGYTTTNLVIARPHNAYNIFFILERAKLIQDCINNGKCLNENESFIQQIICSPDFRGYDHLILPELPPQYHDLQLPADWYVPGRNAKRKHKATHGCK